ncbi:unnamed protein product [Cochlearia groenlandica]
MVQKQVCSDTDMSMESVTEDQSSRPLNTENQGTRPLDTDQQSVRPPDIDHTSSIEQHEEVVTRAMAKKLVDDVQALIVEELGGAAMSFFNIFTKA